MRVDLDADPGGIGRLTAAVEQAAGTLTAVDVVESHPDRLVVDVTCNARDADHAAQLAKAVGRLDGVEIRKVSDRNLSFLHSTSPRLTRPSWPGEQPPASDGRKVEGNPDRCPTSVPHPRSRQRRFTSVGRLEHHAYLTSPPAWCRRALPTNPGRR